MTNILVNLNYTLVVRICQEGMKKGSSRKVGGANKGLGEAPKSCTRKEHESATNSIAKRGQGAIAPCRVKGQRPLWGLGQRPNCSASNLLKGRSQQGAGSEASLPVTLRVLRRAPNLLFLLLAHCRAKWARPSCWSFRHSCSFPKAGDFASAEATKGLSDRPLETFGAATFGVVCGWLMP